MNPWRKIDIQVKKGLIEDKDLNDFLSPFFDSATERKKFIQKCLLKLKTRRMLLRTQWYAEIADGLDVVRSNRPALQIIFLMSLAEGVARLRTGVMDDDTVSSRKMIYEFFKFTTAEDKKSLAQKFQRALISYKHHKLRFSSAISILYDIRNKAVHGDDFYSFSLLNEKQKKEFVDGGYTHYGIMTTGFLGKRGKRKRRVSLDIVLTYKELRAIIARTALENIRKLF
ncbi:hypothetical protein HY250_04315 [Candidatus Azambacteria bacterium]|nr:hypothetical protein [Candidatus Azambacteria bacterium]MBI3685602.1 hypothetical protein [Candidatus Azambacteria bacterium]